MARPIKAEFDGEIFPSQRALAKHLAARLGLSRNYVGDLLRAHDGDPAAVLSTPRLTKPAEYDGRSFASLTELARYLAARLGRSVSAVQGLLSRYKGDAATVVWHCRHVEQRPAKPIVYQDRVFASRSAAAHYIAGVLRWRHVAAIGVQLAQHADDVAAVLAYYRQRLRIDDGKRFLGRRALACYLARRLGCSAMRVAELLAQHNDDAAAVVALCPQRVPRIEAAHDGQRYSSRAALARYLVPLLGCSSRTANYLLVKHNDDVSAVIASGGVRAPRPAKRILYEEHLFNRQELIRHLVRTSGYDANRLTWVLKQHDDDVTAALDAYDRPGPTRGVPVTVGGVTYRSKAAFARAVQQRFGVPVNSIRDLVAKHPPEFVLQWARARHDAR
jgi:hypothetical protein